MGLFAWGFSPGFRYLCVRGGMWVREGKSGRIELVEWVLWSCKAAESVKEHIGTVWCDCACVCGVYVCAHMWGKGSTSFILINVYSSIIALQYCVGFWRTTQWTSHIRLPRWLRGKESTCSAGDIRDAGSALGQEDRLEEGMAAHSSILAWRTPRTEEPGSLQTIRFRQD